MPRLSATLPVVLMLSLVAGAQAPVNDTCSASLPATDGSVPFDTTSATTDGPAQPGAFSYGDDQVHRDVWFSYTASCNGFLSVTTCEHLGGGATFDTRLAVYAAGATCPPLAGELLGANDDDPYHPCGTIAGGYRSTLEVHVSAGQTYLVRVGGFDATSGGPGSLFLSCRAEPAAPSWITFTDETATRISASPALSTADPEEKDYAWGDIDQDGDDDLVCVRKEPFNTPGRFANVLFMNEGIAEGHAIDGVLVDRTATYASAATDGGQGFLDATADRDVSLVDVDGDGWLDIVTSTTYGGGLPDSISHPRIYMNLGAPSGVWLGFEFQHTRTPIMPLTPNFCAVASGDVTGDGSPDLYFVEYNNTLEDRLWVNDGNGFFTDETTTRLTPAMVFSDFGVHAVIADINGDGVNDIVKDRASSATQPPLQVQIMYNDVSNEGFFGTMEVIYSGNPYHVDVGDLNNDGLLDIVVEDDGTDQIMLNIGNGGDGLADFNTSPISGVGDGLGGNIVIRDLDQDGFKDLVIADVDVDCCGFTRHMKLWRNLGNPPTVTFQEESGGIPISARTGTHDVGVFDVNGDTWLDLVIGTYQGMSVWIQQPGTGLRIHHPAGRPTFSHPDGTTHFDVTVEGLGGAAVAAGSVMLHTSVNQGPFTATAMTSLGGDGWRGMLPAAGCGDAVRFYVSAQTTSGTTVTDPAGAPTDAWEAAVATGTETIMFESFEGDVSAWTVQSTNVTAGDWEQAVPIGTFFTPTLPAAPGEDGEPGAGLDTCFVTGNGVLGGPVGAADLDGGPTALVSPPIDLAGSDAIISYRRWFFSSGTDPLIVFVSPDGTVWHTVEIVTDTGGAWESASFRVSDHITPTSTVHVRFWTLDQPNNSITEAAIDRFVVEKLTCHTCQSDLGGGTAGVTLTMCGGDLSAGTEADLVLTGAPPQTLAFFAADVTTSPQPIFGGTAFVTAGALVIQTATNAKGDAIFPDIAGGIGNVTIYIQALYADGSLPGGYGLSNAVEVDFLP